MPSRDLHTDRVDVQDVDDGRAVSGMIEPVCGDSGRAAVHSTDDCHAGGSAADSPAAAAASQVNGAEARNLPHAQRPGIRGPPGSGRNGWMPLRSRSSEAHDRGWRQHTKSWRHLRRRRHEDRRQRLT